MYGQERAKFPSTVYAHTILILPPPPFFLRSFRDGKARADPGSRLKAHQPDLENSGDRIVENNDCPLRILEKNSLTNFDFNKSAHFLSKYP